MDRLAIEVVVLNDHGDERGMHRGTIDEDRLDQAAVLALFIPLLTGTASSACAEQHV